MFTEAEKAYKKALRIYKDMAKENLERHELGVAKTLDNMGTFYADAGRFSQAESRHTEALRIMQHFVETNPDMYNPILATTLNNLGGFYRSAGKFFEAREAYTGALKIRESMAEKENHPKVYESIAVTHNCLGLLHFDTAEFPESKEEFQKALNTYKNLEKEKKDTYTSNVAGCLNNIGNCHMKLNQYSEAEKAYKEALKKYRNLEKRNPTVYTPRVATSLNNLGALYSTTGKLSKAEKTYNEAVEKYKEVSLWSDASRTHYNLSTIEPGTESLEKSRRLLELAILFSKEEKYKYAQKGAIESMYLRLLERDVSTFGVLEALRDPQFLSLPWGDISKKGILPEEDLARAQEDIRFQKEVVNVALEKDVLYYEPPTLPADLVFIYIQLIGDSVYFFAVNNDGLRKFKCKKDFFHRGAFLYNYLK
jgi:tetratricopeptide (TPR) repeat protein